MDASPFLIGLGKRKPLGSIRLGAPSVRKPCGRNAVYVLGQVLQRIRNRAVLLQDIVNRFVDCVFHIRNRNENAVAAKEGLALAKGPFLTLLILGVTGLTRCSLLPLVATVLPLRLGIITGNISKPAAAFLRPDMRLLLPFIGVALGAGIDLRQAWLRGITASATRANTLAVPAAIALVNPLWQAYVSVATSMIAAAMVIGAVVIPILAGKCAKPRERTGE